MRLVLYQPDIAQNTGALFRLAACLGVPVDLIEPCGFVLDDRRLKRVAIGGYELGDLPAGKFRHLNTSELRRLSER